MHGSPQLSTDSSVSSHSQSKDNCDTTTQANESSPSSPQSSYNSSYGSNSGGKLINNSNNNITALVPGGVVTTQNISTVIRPKDNNNSLQFVKIQTPELSKKAVEQIRIAEETKISKEKIKEVEEEWQNNLLNWKSKRRQQFTHVVDHEPDKLESGVAAGGRKIKTFAEMIEQRAKSGNRLGFHLQRYIDTENEDEIPIPTVDANCNLSEVDSAPKVCRADSDIDNLSSTSSGYNQFDSKSPSLPDGSLDNVRVSTQPEERTLELNQITTSNQDYSGLDCRVTDNQHSISLVDSSDSKQLNSTLKQEIRPSPPPVVPARNKPLLDIDTTTIKAIGRSEDESDNSAFEDDEEEQEEEEEQKHLQRIAFEAKLKAFEKMTKPAIKSPKLVAPKPTPPRPVPKIPNPTNSFEKQVQPQQLKRLESPVVNQQPIVNLVQKPKFPPPYSHSPATKLESSMEIHKDSTESLVHSISQSESIHKQRNLPLPQPIPEPNKPVSSQRKSTKDDKDRTVLSVSGKKRCSSCKEELGRGAAAFVVESLSLVYHTNCFRCSVCHVNLSNGFCSVDVRVQAKALHCQDCYSKDGLNYSKV